MLTVAEIRRKLAALPKNERCATGCKGWFIAAKHQSGESGFEVQRCDECCHRLAFLNSDSNFSLLILDTDVAQLPEAQLALAQMIKRVHREDHGTCYGMFADWCPHCLRKLSWLRRAA